MNECSNSCTPEEIPERYKGTPIESLWKYQNRKNPCSILSEQPRAKLIIGMCMDNRKNLKIPDNFAYIIRTGGANLRASDFHMSYAVSIGAIKHIAVIGHTGCGMVDILSRKEEFVKGMVETAGWGRAESERYFMHSYETYEIKNEGIFTVEEARRLRLRYPDLVVAPMLYRVENDEICFLKEDN